MQKLANAPAGDALMGHSEQTFAGQGGIDAEELLYSRNPMISSVEQ